MFKAQAYFSKCIESFLTICLTHEIFSIIYCDAEFKLFSNFPIHLLCSYTFVQTLTLRQAMLLNIAAMTDGKG